MNPTSAANASTPPRADAAPAPLSFEDLASQYNYLRFNFYGAVLADLVIDERRRHEGPLQVLDIGCGNGIGRDNTLQWKIREIADDYWGIEPDPQIRPVKGLFDNYQNALMETAELPASHFDVAYSSMVMEHVADPDSFFSAVHRCLKPGGVYLFATPNARSFVPWASRTLHRLKVDELALRVIRRKEVIDEYHYPLQFKCNSPRELDAIASRVGFAPPQYAYAEGPGTQNYLRGPLTPIGKFLHLKRRWLRRPEALATLYCRMAKI